MAIKLVKVLKSNNIRTTFIGAPLIKSKGIFDKRPIRITNNNVFHETNLAMFKSE